MLRIHNSLTGRKEPLKPLRPGQVGLYVCGATVYDYCHVGHARCYVVFDVIRRWLRQSGYAVRYVRNITDIDDKIIRRAGERGEPVEALALRFTQAMHEDFAALAIEPPDVEPRATEFMPQIIAMIERLLGRGYAYRSADGDVLYAVSKFPDYGKLSGKRLSELRVGARVQVDVHKHDPLDFVLWKAAKPGEPTWDSPWGPGRPGWHIECSAMSTTLLGQQFDLHGGGMDLKFPHHENEIAQSCAASGDGFVSVWVHNGFVTVDEQKMSKSLGNFFTVRELLPKLRHPEVLRAFLLSSHYRGPINYSNAQLEQADAMLGRLYTALRDAGALPRGADDDAPGAALASEHGERFRAALDDDFNTPEALAALQGLTRELNGRRARDDRTAAARLAAQLRALGGLLGLLQQDPEQWFRRAPLLRLEEHEIEALIGARAEARSRRDFAAADRIRGQLEQSGVLLEDRPNGETRWRRA